MTEPASIRFKNPGAMWGRTGKRPSADRIVPTNYPLALTWGSTQTSYLSDGLGQGNNIAIFPDFVHGICAQIDLWRTPRYHNKRFAEAINVWDGGNSTSSYIHFVTALVPGMTADTITSDAMLGSPMGLAFLKAQAWHEAGKQYPAPDADWIEAQRRVFGGAAAPKPEDVPVPTPLLRDTRWLQASLNALGASPALDVDGIVGPALRGAISAFQSKHGLDADGLVGPATMRAIEEDLAAPKPLPKPPEIKLPPPGAPVPSGLAPTFWGRVVALFRPKGN